MIHITISQNSCLRCVTKIIFSLTIKIRLRSSFLRPRYHADIRKISDQLRPTINAAVLAN